MGKASNVAFNALACGQMLCQLLGCSAAQRWALGSARRSEAGPLAGRAEQAMQSSAGAMLLLGAALGLPLPSLPCLHQRPPPWERFNKGVGHS